MLLSRAIKSSLWRNRNVISTHKWANGIQSSLTTCSAYHTNVNQNQNQYSLLIPQSQLPCPMNHTLQLRSFYRWSSQLGKSSQNNGDVSKEENLGIGTRFKQMFKNYWYVLVPVHLATSAVWFGGFYIMCKSGVDVGAILLYFGTSVEYVEKISDSPWGYLALAYACYKIATPARYTVTVAGTTMTVKHLSDLGYLKTTNEVATEMREKKDNLAHDIREKREQYIDRREKFRDEWSAAWQKFASKRKKL